MSKNSKRTRCKVCKKRVNLVYSPGKANYIYLMCPNCGSHGELKINRRI